MIISPILSAKLLQTYYVSLAIIFDSCHKNANSARMLAKYFTIKKKVENDFRLITNVSLPNQP